jgi:two-component system NtrC family response regulator
MSIFNSIEILVVDDESNIRKLFARELAAPGRTIHTAGTAAEAFELLHKNYYDIIILDIRLPDANGLELMVRLLETVPNVAIILITGYADVDNAVEAMKNGAYDYITKPFSLERMEQVIEKAYQRVRLQRENELLRHNTDHKPTPRFIGHSRSVQDVRFLLEKAAPTDVPVLLTGESGTGKNVAAAALHAKSKRADQPLIIKNCGTFDKELLRSELFGYCKGAFTGADRSHDGLLSLAHKGTLFFDEVGELSLDLQGALLRVLETQHFRRVGDKEERCVDVRFIFATNKNLAKEVEEGRFHDAFFHRINVFTIELPPLRERREDIPSLVEFFLTALAKDGQEYKISPRAMQQLMDNPWPGNVRELKNIIERGMILAENNIINVKALPFCQKSCQNPRDKNFSTLEELERSHISMIMHAVQGNKSRAAQLLGIGRKTLYRKLEEYRLSETGGSEPGLLGKQRMSHSDT